MKSKKEVYRIFYLTKGHLEVTESTARECYDSYFERLWGVVENTTQLDEEFEILWSEKMKDN